MNVRRGIASALVLVFILGFTGAAAIAQSAAPPTPAKPITMTPVKVDVVISRFQGEKKVGSLPFTMWLTVSSAGYPANQSTRVGVDVPIGATTVNTGRTNNSGPPASSTSTTTSEATTKTEYRWLGTQVDCRANAGSSPAEEGRIWISVSVADSSIYTSDADPKTALKVTDPMAFRTFNMNNNLLMRDGQTLQFATATDKVTGETIRVDVTMTVLK